MVLLCEHGLRILVKNLLLLVSRDVCGMYFCQLRDEGATGAVTSLDDMVGADVLDERLCVAVGCLAAADVQVNVR